MAQTHKPTAKCCFEEASAAKIAMIDSLMCGSAARDDTADRISRAPVRWDKLARMLQLKFRRPGLRLRYFNGYAMGVQSMVRPWLESGIARGADEC